MARVAMFWKVAASIPGTTASHMRRHCHLRKIRVDEFGMVAELLDGTEDVVPVPAVEARRVLSQFVQDFVHLKCRQNRLNQNCGFNRAPGNAQQLLGQYEDIVPETRLEMAFKLGQVEVGTCTLIEQRSGTQDISLF